MAETDPFVIQIPNNLRAQNPQFWEYMQIFLFKLWKRSGGGDDLLVELQDQITENGVRIASNDSDIAGLNSSVTSLNNSVSDINDQLDFTYYSVSANRTTAGNEVLDITASCTITLNSTPTNKEKVVARNANGSNIIIDGGSKNISGEDKLITIRKNTVLVLVYYSDSGQWMVGL